MLTGYWTLVSQDTRANGLLDTGLPRYNTPSRYLDSTIKSPYGRTIVKQYLHRIIEAAGLRQISGEYLSLLWRSTHCRGRRKVEEYSSSEVPDSDNNSIKEFVEFSELSFRTNFAESLGSCFEFCRISWKLLRKLSCRIPTCFGNRVTDFPLPFLEVTERLREREDLL